MVVGFYLALALAGIFWHGAAQNSNDVWRQDPQASVLVLVGSVLLGALVGVGIVAAFRWLELRQSWIPSLHAEFRAVFGQLQAHELVLFAGASALGEEILFRGAMLDAWGLVLSSLVFGLLHLPPRRELWPWTLSSLLIGLLFGCLTLLTGNLGAAVCAHFVVNLVNMHYITSRGPAVVLQGSRIEVADERDRGTMRP